MPSGVVLSSLCDLSELEVSRRFFFVLAMISQMGYSCRSISNRGDYSPLSEAAFHCLTTPYAPAVNMYYGVDAMV